MARRVGSPKAEVMADTAAEKSAAESAGAAAGGPSRVLPTPVSYRGDQPASEASTWPPRNEITNRVTGAVRALPGVDDVDLDFTVMTDEERTALRERLHGDPASTAGHNHAHGHAEGRAIPFADPSSRTRVLLVASGKGGVGKSSVTVNLAVALAQRGRRVAVIDADVWGFSIPAMLGVDHPPTLIDQMVVPPEAHGVRV